MGLISSTFLPSAFKRFNLLMTISARQFTHLQEMGIAVFQRKDLQVSDSDIRGQDDSTLSTAQQTNNIAAPQSIAIGTDKSSANHVDNESTNASATSASFSVAIPTMAELSESQLFKDLLIHLSLSIGEVELTAEHINLGFINWRMLADEQKDCTAINLTNGLLISPSLQTVSQSVALKRQLWSTLQTSVVS